MGSIANLIGDLKVLVTAATLKPPEPDSIGSFGLLVQQHADSHPHGVALLCEDEVVTWQELNERTNRVAAILKAQGILPGDCVSLFMQNRIEFVVQIAAITRLGAIGGLINTNLSKKQLVHCIALTESKKCIFGEELIEPLNEIRHALDLKDGEDYCLFVTRASKHRQPGPPSSIQRMKIQMPVTTLSQRPSPWVIRRSIYLPLEQPDFRRLLSCHPRG